MNNIQADIITIGDEILIGQIVDTNSAWMGQHLNNIGIEVRQITSISDKKDAIVSTLNAVIPHTNIVFITGGLGPTNDDITKHTLTEYFGGKLIYHDEALQNIEAFIKLRNGEMNKNNYDQALFPNNAIFIPNKNGTASGMWFEKNDRIIISMPGVPHEMTKMMEEYVLPKLQTKFELPYILHKTVIVTDIAEAKLAEVISSWENSLPSDIKLAYLPSPGLVKLRMSITGNDIELMEASVKCEISKLQNIIPQHLSGYKDEPIEIIVGNILNSKNITLATAESCTGGAISARITSIAGSSSYYKGSIIAYSNEIKNQLLNVPAEILSNYGAVSKEVVELMAQNIRRIMNTDIGVAVSGIAGPEGGSAEKPVGSVWVAACNGKSTVSKLYLFGNSRKDNIEKTVNAALTMVVNMAKDL